jgi:hypothetical protein
MRMREKEREIKEDINEKRERVFKTFIKAK